MGDGLYSITLGGGRAGITIKQPLTAHTTPEQLSDELRRAGWVGAEGCGGGAAGERNVHPQQN